MSPLVWAGIILGGAGGVWLLAWVLTRLPPRRALAVVVLVAAGGLALMRLFPLAAPLAAVGVGLWRSGGAIRTPGTSSQVESACLRMTLDHDSGRMEGEVTGGTFAGRVLSKMTAAELDRLMADLAVAGDDDGRALLLAWLERHGPPREPGAEAEAPPGLGEMTPADAYRILGLAPGASRDEVREAYGRLIRRVHPDLGGTSALAALLNAAKEVLDPS